MKDLIELYYNSKNLQSFFSLLNKKYNKHLLNKFNEFKKNTCYFYMCHDSNPDSQAVYNLINGINSYPTYHDGGLKIFKNFTDGYYSEDEYMKNILPTFLSFIHDEKYVYPALKHLGCRTFKIF